MIDRVFNRIASFDERSRKFPITALIPTKQRRSYTWSHCNTWLDQGQEGACTGFAVAHEAAAKPKPVKGITNEVAKAIYHRARQLDEWEGENYEGSSVLGAIKAASERGWYSEYRWAFGENDLALAVGYRGPVVLGINWYEGMCEPDEFGSIAPTGKCVGGHAIMCRGYNAKTHHYRLHNSWGRDWGIDGDCFLWAGYMEQLLKESGEACIPTGRLLV